jgi:hypothetical protein
MLLTGLHVTNSGNVDRHPLSIDSDRTWVVTPAAKVPTTRMLFTLAIPDHRLDLFLHDLPGQKAGDLCVMLQKLEFHVDRLVEEMFKRVGNWRLFGASAMLRIHDRGSSSVIGLVSYAPGKNPFSVSSFN